MTKASKNTKTSKSTKTTTESQDYYEEFLHPNMEEKAKKYSMKRVEQKGCGNRCTEWFLHFDKTVMRPFFIYNYDVEHSSK